MMCMTYMMLQFKTDTNLDAFTVPPAIIATTSFAKLRIEQSNAALGYPPPARKQQSG